MSFSEVVNTILLNADYFVLVLLRVGGLIFSSPIFGRVNIPSISKIALVSVISFLFFFIFPPLADINYNNVFGFFLVCAGELLIGIILAFITNMFFSVAFIGGQLIDMQIGFGIVNVYDPQNNTQIPMTGNILNIVLLIVLFAVNGHHRLIEILAFTFENLPVGNVGYSSDFGLVTLAIFAKSFTLGVMIAMPVIASGLILEICFGMLIRTVPQMNMFVVGVPLKIIIGFILLALVFPVFVNFSDTIFSEMFLGVELMFSALLTP